MFIKKKLIEYFTKLYNRKLFVNVREFCQNLNFIYLQKESSILLNT